MRIFKSLILAGAAASVLTGAANAQAAPGAPGETPTWAYAAKVGAGRRL